MNLLGIHHVAIIASDYPRSKHFYTEILGLKVLRETFRKARSSYKLDLLLADGTQIELFTFPNSPLRSTRPEAQGLRHLAFRVKDLEANRVILQNHGVSVEEMRIDELTGRRFAFFQDPDGLPLELYEE